MVLGSSPAYLAVMSAAGVLVMRPLVGWTGRSESDCTTGDGACYQVRVLCDEHADGEERNATWVSWGTVPGVEAVKEAEERLGSVKDADLAACDRRVDGPEAGLWRQRALSLAPAALFGRRLVLGLLLIETLPARGSRAITFQQ